MLVDGFCLSESIKVNASQLNHTDRQEWPVLYAYPSKNAWVDEVVAYQKQNTPHFHLRLSAPIKLNCLSAIIRYNANKTKDLQHSLRKLELSSFVIMWRKVDRLLICIMEIKKNWEFQMKCVHVLEIARLTHPTFHVTSKGEKLQFFVVHSWWLLFNDVPVDLNHLRLTDP